MKFYCYHINYAIATAQLHCDGNIFFPCISIHLLFSKVCSGTFTRLTNILYILSIKLIKLDFDYSEQDARIRVEALLSRRAQRIIELFLTFSLFASVS